jgi:tryptophan 2,3-dioxygenase
MSCVFKQILFELDYILKVFSKEKLTTTPKILIWSRIGWGALSGYLKLLNQQVSILDTMTPLDFLEFRNLLIPSSGFQSTQFRLIEATLGLQMDSRHQHDYYKRTTAGGFARPDLDKINQIEASSNVAHLLNNWLERMPFFEQQFWTNYHSVANTMPQVTCFGMTTGRSTRKA